ncbi:MAG TPA: rhomboid family intramembrane serine protease [Marisediminicola sp.]|jgi:membrane associated rhomboid family serine protease|nr:rhomboid family intramembrane serine protease [Marisediminicola sp.]
MTDASGAANHCYRHPDHESYILCQRCGRTICPACRTEAAVGFHCLECVREGRANTPRTKSRLLTSLKRAEGAPVVTYSLIGLTALVYLLQLVSSGLVGALLTYRPLFTEIMPWTMITSVFVHGSFLHILFNMFSLLIFGRILEPMLGRLRFLALYLISGFGGSVAVLLLNPAGGVLGASGAVFGLFAAFFVIQRGLGGNGTQLLVLIAINLAIGFLPGSNVSWQAHLGGLAVGALMAFLFMKTRGPRHRNRQILMTCSVLAALIIVSTLAATTLT